MICLYLPQRRTMLWTMRAIGYVRVSTEKQADHGQLETKFLRLRQAVKLRDEIDGWKVYWLGGWGKGRCSIS
jgi:DNA invertase Pin-like site-specific DNA recombinase